MERSKSQNSLRSVYLKKKILNLPNSDKFQVVKALTNYKNGLFKSGKHSCLQESDEIRKGINNFGIKLGEAAMIFKNIKSENDKFLDKFKKSKKLHKKSYSEIYLNADLKDQLDQLSSQYYERGYKNIQIHDIFSKNFIISANADIQKQIRFESNPSIFSQDLRFLKKLKRMIDIRLGEEKIFNSTLLNGRLRDSIYPDLDREIKTNRESFLVENRFDIRTKDEIINENKDLEDYITNFKSINHNLAPITNFTKRKALKKKIIVKEIKNPTNMNKKYIITRSLSVADLNHKMQVKKVGFNESKNKENSLQIENLKEKQHNFRKSKGDSKMSSRYSNFNDLENSTMHASQASNFKTKMHQSTLNKEKSYLINQIKESISLIDSKGDKLRTTMKMVNNDNEKSKEIIFDYFRRYTHKDISQLEQNFDERKSNTGDLIKYISDLKSKNSNYSIPDVYNIFTSKVGNIDIEKKNLEKINEINELINRKDFELVRSINSKDFFNN